MSFCIENTQEAGAAGRSLAGVRILDLTRVLAGPFCTQILGDLGAEVIKVEEPGSGDQVRAIAPYYPGGESHYFMAINRNKRSLVVDLKAEEGRQAVLDIAAHCDVVIENFRPQVMDRLGIGFEQLKRRKPDVILVSISGFGMDGPLSDKPSFDLVTQARSGVMSITGDADGPPTKLGLPLGDLGGGLWATIAVLSALQRKSRDPSPQHLDLSLLEGMASLLGYLGQLTMLTGESPGRVGSGHHNVVPYGRFEVRDGHIVLALHVGPFWRRFCHAVGRADLLEDERFRTTDDRRANRDALVPIVEEILRQRTREEWHEILDAADIPHAPILDVGEALDQEQLRNRRALWTLQHPTAGAVDVVGCPIRQADQAEPPTPLPPPLLGQHTREVLAGVAGYGEQQIADLIEREVVAEPSMTGHSTTRSED